MVSPAPEKSLEPMKAETPAALTGNATAAVDATKADTKKTKKNTPLRLINGFRATNWRPKISLETQKDVAEKLVKKLHDRRIKYEKFVDSVLGPADPLKPSVPGAEKQYGKRKNSFRLFTT